MDVGLVLVLREGGRDRGIKVIDGDVILLHDLQCDVIIDGDISEGALRRELAFRDGRGGREDHFGAGLLEVGHERAEVLLVIRRLHLALAVFHVAQVMQAEVEMNHVPLAGTEPLGEVRRAVLGRTTVGRDAMHVGLAGEFLTDGQGVADGNRVADEQHARQAGDVLDRGHRRIQSLGLRLGFGRRFLGRRGLRGVGGEKGERGEGEKQGESLHGVGKYKLSG